MIVALFMADTSGSGLFVGALKMTLLCQYVSALSSVIEIKHTINDMVTFIFGQ